MAISFSLSTDNAVKNLGTLDGALEAVLTKFSRLDKALKAVSSSTVSVKINELSTAMSDMEKKTSLASQQLTQQRQKTDQLKAQVRTLTNELEKLGNQQNKNKDTSKDLSQMTQKELIEKVRLSNANKQLIAEINQLTEAGRRELLNAQANLAANDKRAKQAIEYNRIVDRSRTTLRDLTGIQQQRLTIKKAEIEANERLQQSELRLVKGKLREAEVQKIVNDQKIQALVLEAKNNQGNLRAIAIADLKLKTALKEAETHARTTLGINTETKAQDRNTQAKRRAISTSKELSTSMALGNRHAAEFRAGLSALGVSFGIFTGSTIVAATAIYGTVRALRATIEAGAEFEFTMDRVNAVMNTTVSESTVLEESVRKLAETTIFTAGEVSKGLVFLGMAGFQTNEALLALEPTLRLAQIGMIDMEQAADMVTNIMAGFNIEAGQVAETVDKLSIVVTSSNTSISQLARALSFVGPAAANTNTTLEETTAILGFFGNVGIKASRAGTSLRRGIANLSNPTKAMAERMNQLGIAILDSDGRMRSMAVIMKDLSAAGASMSDIFKIFGTRAGPAFASAIIRGTDEIDKLIEAQKDAEGTSKALASILEDNAYTDFKLTISAAHEVLISFYESIDGPLRKALQGAISLFKTIAPLMSGLGTILGIAIVAVSAYGAAWLAIKALSIPATIALAAGPIQAAGTLAVSAAAATTLWAKSLALLKIGLTFLTGPVGILATVITGLGIAYAFSETESEKLTRSLKEQKEAIEGMNKLRLESGLDKTGDGLGQLDAAIEKLKSLEDLESPTVGQQLTEGLISAEAKAEDLNKVLIRQNQALREANNLNQSDQYKQQIQGRIDTTNRLLEVNKSGFDVISETEKAFIKIGEQLGINNILELSSAQVNKLIQKQKKEQTDQVKESARLEAVKLEDAKKNNTLLATYASISKAINGDDRDLIKEREKARKADQATLFSELKKVGDTDGTVGDKIASNMDARLEDIRSLKQSSKSIDRALNLAINELAVGPFLGEQLDIAIVGKTKSLTELEKINKDIRALEAANLLDIQNLDQAHLEDFLKRREKKRQIVLAEDSITNNIILSNMEKQKQREQDLLDFGLDARTISLQKFANDTIVLEQSITDQKLQALAAQVTSSQEYITVLRQEKRQLGEVHTSGALYVDLIKDETGRVAGLSGQIRLLTATRADEKDATDIVIESLRDYALEGAKANIKLEQQLDLLQLGESATIDSTQSMYKYAIAQAVAAQATGDNSEEMRLLLIELNKLSGAYDANKLKINELDEAWDSTVTSMKGKAKSGAESMQSAFTEFFIAPSKDSLDDLLDHFIKTIQKMLAEKMAAQLFDSNGGGAGNWFTDIFAGIFGAAVGAASGNGGTGVLTTDLGSNFFGTGKAAGGPVDAGRPYFVGESGPEIFVPSKSGDVVPNNQINKSRDSGNTTIFQNTVHITTGESNEAKIRGIVEQGLNSLEGKLARQQQRSQRVAGIRKI